MPPIHAGIAGLTVFERGWLSSNNVLIHGSGDGATLVDTGHSVHAEQTVALVRHALRVALPREPLGRILNTHLHSDHCGGNAALQAAFGAELSLPPGLWDAALRWDEQALGFASIGQRCERFVPHARIVPGEALRLGGRRWEVLASPGHDPDSVMLFDVVEGVLISADALWENGYGIVFPELAGEPGFDDVQRSLDLIESLSVSRVIPGHGAPFTDCAGALRRARSLLAKQRADPRHHSRHAVKVLIKYHLMEERRQTWDELNAWVIARPMFVRVFEEQEAAAGVSMRDWCETLVQELVTRGVLALRDGAVHDVG